MADQQHADTIYALSSGRDRSGVAIVRISGARSAAALEELTGRALPQPRTAMLRRFRSAAGEIIDNGLALWFPAPASFTGEDVAELHVHGGRAVVDGILAALNQVRGLRPAAAGEFTRRAVEHGKFDLTRAEALADLINAETEGQRRQALRQHEGMLFQLYESWRAGLIRATAWAEAAIDFTDEELPDNVLADVQNQVAEIRREIVRHLSDAKRGEILRDGFYLTVIGPPNSGKSSLINALARRDVAIVSDIAGTTRDVLEIHLNIDGYPVIVADTAGVRETAEGIETEGVRRALERAEQADAILLLLDASAPSSVLAKMPSGPVVTVWNKVDLAPAPPGRTLGISVRTGAGVENLVQEIGRMVSTRLQGEAPALTRMRHRTALERARDALQRAAEAGEPEFFAEEIRIALRCLGQITGRADIEEVLDVVFRDFCIGK